MQWNSIQLLRNWNNENDRSRNNPYGKKSSKENSNGLWYMVSLVMKSWIGIFKLDFSQKTEFFPKTNFIELHKKSLIKKMEVILKYDN